MKSFNNFKTFQQTNAQIAKYYYCTTYPLIKRKLGSKHDDIQNCDNEELHIKDWGNSSRFFKLVGQSLEGQVYQLE